MYYTSTVNVETLDTQIDTLTIHYKNSINNYKNVKNQNKIFYNFMIRFNNNQFKGYYNYNALKVFNYIKDKYKNHIKLEYESKADFDTRCIERMNEYILHTDNIKPTDEELETLYQEQIMLFNTTFQKYVYIPCKDFLNNIEEMENILQDIKEKFQDIDFMENICDTEDGMDTPTEDENIN